MTQHDFPKTLPAGALPPDDDAMPVMPFDPVPRLRQRRGGWSEERQRAFIAALSNCGSVAAAARSVGMTPRSAYRLCDADGADSFVRAWDEAIDMGVSRLRADALNRALEGGYVPVYRRGKLVRVEHRRNDRLAIALLGGQQRSAADLRRAAVLRREHRLDLFALTPRAPSISARSRRPRPPFAPRSTGSSRPSSRAAITARESLGSDRRPPAISVQKWSLSRRL